jgi:hypothetical protein
MKGTNPDEPLRIKLNKNTITLNFPKKMKLLKLVSPSICKTIIMQNFSNFFQLNSIV